MFKKKSKKPEQQFRHAGKIAAADGYSALLAAIDLASDVLIHSAGVEHGEALREHMATKAGAASTYPAVRQAANGNTLAGMLHGMALSGLRATAIVDSANFPELEAALSQSTNVVLPAVTVLIDSNGTAAAARDCRMFRLVAGDMQEAVDFLMIAHRIAETSLLPGLVVLDSNHIAKAVQVIHRPEAGLARKYLGRSDDHIETPLPAQKLIFGEKRRRLPRLVDLDRPLGIGTAMHGRTALKGLAAQNEYFYSHLESIAQEAFEAFGALTGRIYQPVQSYHADDAEYVFFTAGVARANVQLAIDHLRRHEKIKAGLVGIRLLHPFPEPAVAAILKGKKGATIVEQATPSFKTAPSLIQNVRIAIDKAVENAAARDDALPHPEFALIDRSSERPQFYSGLYGTDTAPPSAADLIAAAKNMLPGGARKRQFYFGVRFRHPELRLPKLEALQQKLDRAYPERDGRSQPPAEPVEIRDAAQRVLLVAAQEEALQPAAPCLAKALYAGLRWDVHAFPQPIDMPGLRPHAYEVQFAPEAGKPVGFEVAAVSLLDKASIAAMPALANVQQSGVLLIDAAGEPQEIWQAMPERVRRNIREKQLRVYCAPARRIAGEIASDAAGAQGLRAHVLAGAFASLGPGSHRNEREKIRGAYRRALERYFRADADRIDQCFTAFKRGGEEYVALDWQSLPEPPATTAPERDAPWTVKQVCRFDGTVFDLERHWDSVGFLYESGQAEKALTDPFLATGVLPGRSGAFGDTTPIRSELPQIIPEKCTGCGQCWTFCPHTAMPATVQDPGALLAAAMELAAAAGHDMMQLQRIADALIKQAYKLLAGDDLQTYRFFGPLFEAALEQLLGKMQLKDDQKAAISTAMQKVLEHAGDFPIIKTETFFQQAHQKEKGSGLVLSIGIDPRACTGCRLCADICPEAAIEMAPQDGTQQALAEQRWQYLMQLPDPPADRLERFIDAGKPETALYHLLQKKVYYSFLPGRDAAENPGKAIAMHLLTAASELKMRAATDQLLGRIEERINRLGEKIQGNVSGALRINDFEAFAEKLSAVESEQLDLETLARLAQPEQKAKELDRAVLQRQTRLLNRLRALKKAYAEAQNGDGRARMLLAFGDPEPAPGCSYPFNPFPAPWVRLAPGTTAGEAEALFEAMLREMAETFKLLRLADLEIDDLYRKEEHEAAFANFNWHRFSAEERRLCPPVLAILDHSDTPGDLLLRELPVKIVRFDTQAYPLDSGGPISFEQEDKEIAPGGIRKEPALEALMQRRAYVLQAVIGQPGHLIKGILDGLAYPGPAFFNIFCGQQQPSAESGARIVRQNALAVKSRTLPLFRYEPEGEKPLAVCLSLAGNPQPEQDWLVQPATILDAGSRETSLTLLYTFADWAFMEQRFAGHFKLVPRKSWHADMVHLAEYLDLTQDERKGLVPFISIVGEDKTLHRFVVSMQIVQAAEERLGFWRLLKQIAGIDPEREARIELEVSARLEQKAAEVKKQLEADFAARLAALEKEQDRLSHARITQRLLALSGFGGGAEQLRLTLQEYLQKRRPTSSTDKDEE